MTRLKLQSKQKITSPNVLDVLDSRVQKIIQIISGYICVELWVKSH